MRWATRSDDQIKSDFSWDQSKDYTRCGMCSLMQRPGTLMAWTEASCCFGRFKDDYEMIAECSRAASSCTAVCFDCLRKR